MKTYKDIKAVFAKDRNEWRKWLEENHQTEDSVWLIMYKKKSKTPTVYYPEAVEEALCFGWIDSKPNKRDEDSYYQFFSKRNPKSYWSKINKNSIARLKKEGKIMPAGLEMIKIAKANGSWTSLDKIEALVIPEELKEAFTKNPKAFKHYESFPPSSKKIILEWVYSAKRAETKAKRIKEVIEKAEKNERANHYS
ncbi:MAG: hypothetical protein CMP59_02955 [Flavobacteriales bacterium]|nr:hypothetical protein [Flavobacteriales bacterium]|tara:strand:+ start:1725 stop:2309 length:585 start_codon:yes stop_codon:yes gene_type:complete